MPLLPVALYGLEVPCGDILIPAVPDFPATFRITMAALDPTEPPEVDENATGAPPRATLKIVRQPDGDLDDEDDEEYMREILGDSDSESEDEDEDEEVNGGPSDPSKSKKARKEAALKQLMESIDTADSDEEMEDGPNGVNGITADKKGKAKATDEDEDDEEDSEDDDEEVEVEEFVLCTLDPEKHFQQPLDITIAENERVFFKVTGTHTIYLTGNYVIPDDDGHNHHHEIYDSDSDEEDDEYDLSPDEDELELEMDDESDELDDLEDPRVTEVGSDEEEAPKLIKTDDKKGKNKRSAAELDEGASLDDIMAKSLKSEVAADAEPKLSKKQLKKLKKNNGEAAPAKAEETKNAEVKSDKADKKVQFAKNLEQGPTGSTEKAKAVENAEKAKETGDKSKATLGVKTVNGVKIDDKKLGSGPAAKKGDRVSMRYIGKLTNGQVFDSNKKGKPFSFKLGVGECIKGWDIGVAGMQVGGERRLHIPSSLAYGAKGVPGIAPNSDLVFDIKMLEIKK